MKLRIVAGAAVVAILLLSGCTTLVSTTDTNLPSDGDSTWPVVNDNGRYAVFATSAPNLTDGSNVQQIVRKDRTTGVVDVVSLASHGTPGNQPSGLVNERRGPPRRVPIRRHES